MAYRVSLPKYEPGSTGRFKALNPKHEKILDYILQLITMAETQVTGRWDKWQAIDNRLRAYVDVTDVDVFTGRAKYPHDVKLVVPISYAVHMSILTYLFSAIMSRQPAFPIEARHARDMKDIYGAQLMEELLDYDMDQQAADLIVYAWLNDTIRYGVGAVQDEWWEDHRMKTVRGSEPVEVFGVNLGERKTERREWRRVHAGNRTEVIDPYVLLWDARVPVGLHQQGDFIGYTWFKSWQQLKQGELDGKYENVDDIPKLTRERAGAAFTQSRRYDILGLPQIFNISLGPEDRGFVYGHTIWVRIIPSDFDLGKGKYPEIWVITIANYDTVIRMERWDYDHGEYPVNLTEYHYDRHSPMNLAALEPVMPLQDLTDWFVACHDDQTEIMTNRGWIPFPQLQASDAVATVDPRTNAWWYEKPKQIMRSQYRGPMIHFHSSRMNALVTPEHRMWASRQVNRTQETCEPFGFVDARDVFAETRQVSRQWKMQASLGQYVTRIAGSAEPALVLEAQPAKRDRGHRAKYPLVEIPGDLLAEFIGWYVSEGSVTRTAVSLRQKKVSEVQVIDQMMAAWPSHVTRHVDAKGGVSWTISDKRFAAWVKDQCGIGCRAKHLPTVVWTWPRTRQRLVLDAMLLGDGTHWERPAARHCYRYSSLSKALADDAQRLAVGLGWRASVVRDERRGRDPVYRVNMSDSESPVTVARRNVDIMSYDGMIWCVENSTHLIVTRRNGHVLVGGQSHVDNVKKAINNMLLLDPSRINLEDLQRPGAGKWVRTNQSAWGQNVLDQVLKQFPVEDVTGSHTQATQMAIDLMMRATGAVESMLGMQPRSKQAASVYAGMVQMASQRHKVTARIMSAQGIRPWVRHCVQNIQQFMDEETFVQISGTKAKAMGLDPYKMHILRVEPDRIQGNYDFPVHTGDIPPDPNRVVEVWKNILFGVAKLPPLTQRFDLVEIFRYMVYAAGVRNFDAFLIKTQVMPDEEVMRQQQAGNIVPAQEVTGNGQGTPSPAERLALAGGGRAARGPGAQEGRYALDAFAGPGEPSGLADLLKGAQ